jgi:hypothetical protein
VMKLKIKKSVKHLVTIKETYSDNIIIH